MENYLLNKLTKVFLLALFCCPFAFTQWYFSYINYNYGGGFREVLTKEFFVVVKESYCYGGDHYDENLLKRIDTSIYSIINASLDPKYRRIDLKIKVDDVKDIKHINIIRDINILDHYLKFEKEEYVDFIYSQSFVHSAEFLPCVRGQVFQNDEPLRNHIVNIHYNFDSLVAYMSKYLPGNNPYEFLNICTSITDENGNYIFPSVDRSNVPYTISFKIGDIRYDTSVFLINRDEWIKIVNFNNGIIGINEPKEIPTTYGLSQNYPNPFNPSTNFSYSVPNKTDVRITVYDLFGREIKTLVNECKETGTYNITWNGRDNNNRQVATGVYFYKMQAGGFQKTMKMMLVK